MGHPGHPLFEAVRDEALDRVHDHLKRGAIFYDIQRKAPAFWTSSRPRSRMAGDGRSTAGFLWSRRTQRAR